MVTSEGVKEREEVFYTIPLQGKRRHSVGGYLATGGAGTGGGEVTTVPSEVPKMPPPRFNHVDDDVVKRRRPKNFSFKGKCTFTKAILCVHISYRYRVDRNDIRSRQWAQSQSLIVPYL